jgi:transposase
VGQVSTIGLDIAKHVFQAHGADASGHVVFRKKITRAKLIEFMASQPRAWWPWRRAAGPITGPARSPNWVTRSA